jgi:hypothetical protein
MILLFTVWALIIGAGYVVKKKFFYPLLYFEQNKYLKELFTFGFQFLAQFDNSAIFRSRNIYREADIFKVQEQQISQSASSADFAMSSDQLCAIPERDEELA